MDVSGRMTRDIPELVFILLLRRPGNLLPRLAREAGGNKKGSPLPGFTDKMDGEKPDLDIDTLSILGHL